MEDVVVYAKVFVADNCLFVNGHHLSLLKNDLVEFFGDCALQFCRCGADELTLRLWKASAVRSTPLERGRIVTANLLHELPAVITSESSHPTISSTNHLHVDKKFMAVFCSAHFCSVFGLCNKEVIILQLCAEFPGIERVVLGAATDEAFRWASGESFRMELRAVMSKQTLLCEEGCNFGIHVCCSSEDSDSELWEQLSVINCIPVCQGRLTEASEIVIRCHSQPRSTSSIHECSCRNCYCYQCDDDDDDDDDDVRAIMVSDFAAAVTKNCSYLQSLKVDVSLSSLQMDPAPTHEFRFSILTDVDRLKYPISFQQLQNIPDAFSVAIFSRQGASSLGVMNGNILELSCRAHECQWHSSVSSSIRPSLSENQICRRKLVIACVDTAHNNDDILAFISSCAWFNLCRLTCMSLSGHGDIQLCYVKVRVCNCLKTN